MKTQIIAVMNSKGGIGKTITSSSLAYTLGTDHKKKTLIIEADQQGNISKLFGRYTPEGIGMSELLEHHKSLGGDYTTSSLIQTTNYENIDIIPGNGYLMKTNINLFMKEDNQINRLKTALEEIKGVYDYIICDCGLTFDMIVINVLIAADKVIAPVKVGGFEIDAVHNLINQVEDLKGFNSNLSVKLLMTMRQGNKTSLQTEEWIKSNFNTYKHSIRRSIRVEDSTSAFQPLPEFSRGCTASKDYREVVKELLEEE